MSRGLTLLFAVAGGTAVGNLYWAQPLLANIASEFGISVAAAGLLVTVTQVGYGSGVFLVVPLGDTLNRRRLIPALLACSVVVLLASAFAPSYGILLITLGGVGLTTVTGQLLTPLAGDLALENQRGQVVGIVASGILTGILASRTVSGLIADLFGWRAIYIFAAAATALMAVLLAWALPELPVREHVPYGRLLRSIFTTVRKHAAVQVTLILGACVFAVFTMFWTALTFLLSAEPFSYPPSKIGLVGLAGLAGAVAAQRAGRFHDAGWSVPATGAALVLALLSLALAWIGSRSIVAIVGAVILIDVAIQTINVLNQTRLLTVDANARSRLNTVFVTGIFIGGAIGSALAGVLWQRGGWTAVMLGASSLIAAAFVVWITQRGRALVVSPKGTAPIAAKENVVGKI